MKKKIISALLYVSLAALAAGCYAEAYTVAPGPVVVSAPPPAEVVYTEGACPVDYVWVGDYYHWNGYSWVLIQGGCTYRPGYVWIAPSYIHISGGVKYVGGYWKPAPHHTHYVQATPPSGPKHYYATPPKGPKTYYATPPKAPKTYYAVPPSSPKKYKAVPPTAPSKAPHSHAIHPKVQAIPKK